MIVKTEEVIFHTYETGIGLIRIINSALEKVVVEAGDIVMSLDLTTHVMAVTSKATNMLAHLFYGVQRLHHLSSFA